MQGRIALNRRAILLSSRNLHVSVMNFAYIDLYQEGQLDHFYLLRIR